jgi:acyl phosphate:glycerol-3-phosphate acyltransferase
VSPSFDWSLLLACVGASVFGYLCGSIPFGPILTRLAGTQDLRSVGSGNIGATNVLRAGHKGLAAATLVGDMLKGTAAALVARYWWSRELALLAGFGAFLGHLFPIWLGFKGGKGVATYLGILLALAWPAALVFALVWLAVAAASRYSSLAALVASAAMPPTLWLLDHRAEAGLFAVLTVLLWIMHRANIARLRDGTEGKIRISPSAQAKGASDYEALHSNRKPLR